MDENERIFSVGNTDVKISKDGRVQIKVKKGTGSIKLEGGSGFTTTSTSWTDVTGFTRDLSKETKKTNGEQQLILQGVIDLAKGIEELLKNRKRDLIISIIASGVLGAILGYLLGKFG